MAEELQHLLKRINDDYLQKAEAEKAELIGRAKKEASDIVEKAKQEAAGIVEKAKREADNFQSRAREAAVQAARDVVLKLRSELESRLKKAVLGATGAALSPEFMAEIIKDMVAAFARDPNAEISVLCNRRDAEELKSVLKATLADSFQKEPQVFPAAGIKSGMQVGFRGDEVYFDFSDAAVGDLLNSYLGSELAKLLQEKKKTTDVGAKGESPS